MNIAFFNSKGGVAKTTSLCSIAQILAVSGYNILVVDMDSQMNASRTFGFKNESEKIDYEKLLCSRLQKAEEMETFIRKTNFENINMIPAMRDELGEMSEKIYENCKKHPNAELYFMKNMELIKNKFDYIMFDTSPSWTRIDRVALAATDVVFIPVGTDNYGYEGIIKVIKNASEFNSRYNLEIRIGGIFMTQSRTNTYVFHSMYKSYQRNYPDIFIDLPIRQCNAVVEANTAYEPLYLYDKRCNAIAEYAALAVRMGLMDKEHSFRFKEELKKRKQG